MGTFATTTGLKIKMIGTIFDSATTDLADACITDAENEIKKRLGKTYDFSVAPFLTTTTIPPLITSLAESYAIGFMYENGARGSTEAYARADRYIKAANENIKMLVDSEAELLDTTDTAVSRLDGSWAFKTSGAEDYEPTFNEDDPKNWNVDSDKLDDIASDRE